ncbi:hypothetical protein QOZ80_5BG0423470 [Eleusine coracana subsp. coracana]|nr:hypothetical protein QOZ80_5BG0423470 [Eleusine coracana subsp. coracana]
MSTPATVAPAVRMSKGPTSPAPVSLNDNDDLLLEIFLRLPPLPSSIPRAFLVCKRWHRLLSDPGFLRRFRARHRTPPLLGLFTPTFSFVPLLSPPDQIPYEHFRLRRALARAGISTAAAMASPPS